MNKINKNLRQYRTDFLFPNTNFLIGMGSILNIGGDYFEFNYSESDEDPDIKAIGSDWGMVGQDIKIAAIDLNEEDSLN